MSFAILRTAKLKKIGNIVASLNHTLREIDTPNADPNRTAWNINSHATTQQALEDIKKRLPEKIREDNVLCIEYLITASPNWNGWHTQKEDEYFKKSIEWLEQKHGKENVIVTSIQRDESTPHLVAYVVPITKNKKGKEILNAKNFLGGRQKLTEMQTEFAQKISEPLGLTRGVEGSKATHDRVKRFYSKVNGSEITPDIEIEIPKKGLMEKHEDYENRVIKMLDEKVTPIIDRTVALQNALIITERENEQLKKTNQSLSEFSHPFRLAVQDLNTDNRQKLIQNMQSMGDTYRHHQSQEEQEKLSRLAEERRQKRLAEIEKEKEERAAWLAERERQKAEQLAELRRKSQQNSERIRKKYEEEKKQYESQKRSERSERSKSSRKSTPKP